MMDAISVNKVTPHQSTRTDLTIGFCETSKGKRLQSPARPGPPVTPVPDVNRPMQQAVRLPAPSSGPTTTEALPTTPATSPNAPSIPPNFRSRIKSKLKKNWAIKIENEKLNAYRCHISLSSQLKPTIQKLLPPFLKQPKKTYLLAGPIRIGVANFVFLPCPAEREIRLAQYYAPSPSESFSDARAVKSRYHPKILNF